VPVAALYDVHGNLPAYDVEPTLGGLVATGMPGVERVVVRAVRGRVTAEEAIRFFESQRGA
jgi:hypothetical protein